jgi:proteasome activator subunit 4
LKPRVDLIQTEKWMTNLQKYIALYGCKFTLEDHVWFIKVLYGLLTTPNVDPLNIEKYGKLLISMVKKKYLLLKANLFLDWKPLYKIVFKYEDSSAALRGMIKVQAGLKATLRTVVKFTRSFF